MHSLGVLTSKYFITCLYFAFGEIQKTKTQQLTMMSGSCKAFQRGIHIL